MCVCRFWLAKRDRDFYGDFDGKLEGLEQILTFEKLYVLSTTLGELFMGCENSSYTSTLIYTGKKYSKD